MMKKLLFVLCVLLAVLLLVSACSSGNSGTPDAPAASADAQTAPVSTEEETTALSIAAVVPADIDLKGRETRFFTELGNTGTETLRNDSLYQEEDTGDLVVSAVYNRNVRVEDYLNTKIVISRSCKPQAMNKELGNQIAAGSDDCEVAAAYQCYTIQASALGYIMPYEKVKNIDLTREYWAADYIRDISYKGTYWAVGDIDLCYTGGLYVTFINSRLWTDAMGKEDVYDVVRSGKWTFDYYRQACEKAYKDANGDGEVNKGDILGSQYSLADMYGAGMNARFSAHDKNGQPYLTVNTEHIFDVWNKMYQFLFETKGVVTLSDKYYDNFREGNLLSYVYLVNSASLFLREMEDDYYILPVPKMDEKQEDYTTQIHDYITLFGLPITTSYADETGAVLEAMAVDSWLNVMPVYYDDALKSKYSRDKNSAEMIDLIRDSAETDFAYIYSEAIGGGMGTTGKGIHRIFRTAYTEKMTSIASYVQSNIGVWQKNFEDLLAAYDKLG